MFPYTVISKFINTDFIEASNIYYYIFTHCVIKMQNINNQPFESELGATLDVSYPALNTDNRTSD